MNGSEPDLERIRARQRQLRESLERKGIRDPRVLDAIETTRRDLFVPEAYRDDAYADNALPLGDGQTISQPFIVALMTELLRLTGDETVLEIGTGSGYQAAILARLARHVVTIERLESLSETPRRLLDDMELDNVEFHVGDGTRGWPDAAPYDGILVTAAAPSVPTPLYDQLRLGGRIVIPVGDESMQDLQVVEKRESGPHVETACGCRFVKLIGEYGWPA